MSKRKQFQGHSEFNNWRTWIWDLLQVNNTAENNHTTLVKYTEKNGKLKW